MSNRLNWLSISFSSSYPKKSDNCFNEIYIYCNNYRLLRCELREHFLRLRPASFPLALRILAKIIIPPTWPCISLPGRFSVTGFSCLTTGLQVAKSAGYKYVAPLEVRTESQTVKFFRTCENFAEELASALLTT